MMEAQAHQIFVTPVFNLNMKRLKTWETKSGHKIIQVLSGRSNVFLLKNEGKNILVDTSTKYMWYLLKRRLNHLNIIGLII